MPGRPGHHAVVVGWNTDDTTRLWLEGWKACEQGWRVDVVAHSLNQIRPQLFPDSTLLVWCPTPPGSPQAAQLRDWEQRENLIWLNSN